MATISQYVLRDADDNEVDSRVWEQDEYEDAKRAAREAKAMLIELEYEYSDSSLVHNYLETPEGCTGSVSQDIGGIQHDEPCPVHQEKR